jgi:hypothetical protein
MMKRYLVISAVALLIILVIGGGWLLMKSNRNNMSTINNGRVRFEYGDEDILTDLSEEDLNTIKEIFDNKKLYKDNPSCGFSESIAVLLNDDSQIFCIARDTCPIIYSKNEGLYFKISDEENTLLRNLLIKYGFYFPCI